jgi:hypothetical protein
MPAVFVLAMLLAACAVFAVPLLGIAAALVIFAVLAIGVAIIRSMFDGIGELFEHPLVKTLAIGAVLLAAHALFKIPLLIIGILAAVVALLFWLAEHVQTFLDELHPVWQFLLLVVGVILVVAYTRGH